MRAELIDGPRADAARTERRLIRLPGRFRRQWVAASSRLAGAPADEVDDRAALAAALAERVRAQASSGTCGRIVLPWLSTVYQVGDRIRGISGQGMSFDGGRGGPIVRRVRHELGEEWRTTLEVD